MFSFRKKNTQIQTAGHSEHDMFVGWNSHKEFLAVVSGKSKDPDEEARFLHIQSLVEQGIAQWEPNLEDARGCLLDGEDGSRLSEEIRKSFRFPELWSGSFKLIAPKATHESDFTARIEVKLPNGKQSKQWSRKACLLMVDHVEFTLTPQQLNALKAYDHWSEIAKDGLSEADNQHLLANLQEASRDMEVKHDDTDLGLYYKGAKMDVGFDDLTFRETEWSISIRELPNGGIQLVPTPEIDDPGLAEKIIKRLGHLNNGNEQATIRIDKQIITLNKDQTKRTRELLKRGKLNQEQRKDFLEDPALYLSKFVFDPDSIEWSPRVRGIEEWTGTVIEAGVDGGMGQESLSVKKPETDSDDKHDESKEEQSSRKDDKTNFDRYLPYPHLNLNSDDFSECSARERVNWGVDHVSVSAEVLDLSVFSEGIELKEHQIESVKWMQAHSKAIDATAREISVAGDHFSDKRGGVLLADDMGLGKTISVLSFIAMRHKEILARGENAAYLIVAPVSLLINWKEELVKFFKHETLFDRVVILHTDHDLSKYRTGSKPSDDLSEKEDGSGVVVEKLGLRIHSDDVNDSYGIDQPGNIVITNYDTVQRYRFSFCAAKWDVLALDEAQATKNPNVMRTASIKAVNAKFRVLMTGTPVENSLVDFWCLNDTHSPGLLCSLYDFKKNYVSKIQKAEPHDAETRKNVAIEIKDLVGDTMLRRLKVDILDADFPTKKEKNYENEPRLNQVMSGEQLDKYESIRLKKNQGDQTCSHHLSILRNLNLASLHPDLLSDEGLPIGNTPKAAREILSKSIKGEILINTILPDVMERGEKILIFALTKTLQWGLARNLEVLYPQIGKISIINGDAKIKSTKSNPSRQRLIQDFEEADGFSICILSPIAAGVGLTITAANHVVHYERHWNPAKESQATDRAYRIGQTKDVYVWYPMAIHPDTEVLSFDKALDGLMKRKMNLQDSILNVEETRVKESDMLDSVMGETKTIRAWDSERLKALNCFEFEALIAVLYVKMGASDSQLTIRSRDKGCDIIVYDYPNNGENILIDAKHTSKEKSLNDADGVKQLLFAKTQYETTLMTDFNRLALTTNSIDVSERINRESSNAGVDVVTRDEILERLLNYPVSIAEIEEKLDSDRLSI